MLLLRASTPAALVRIPRLSHTTTATVTTRTTLCRRRVVIDDRDRHDAHRAVRRRVVIDDPLGRRHRNTRTPPSVSRNI
jgi:hypothetical protein